MTKSGAASNAHSLPKVTREYAGTGLRRNVQLIEEHRNEAGLLESLEPTRQARLSCRLPDISKAVSTTKKGRYAIEEFTHLKAMQFQLSNPV